MVLTVSSYHVIVFTFRMVHIPQSLRRLLISICSLRYCLGGISQRNLVGFWMYTNARRNSEWCQEKKRKILYQANIDCITLHIDHSNHGTAKVYRIFYMWVVARLIMLPVNIVWAGISFPSKTCISRETAVTHINSTRLSTVVISGVLQTERREAGICKAIYEDFGGERKILMCLASYDILIWCLIMY